MKKKRLNKGRQKRKSWFLVKNKGAVVDKGAFSIVAIMSLVIFGGYYLVGGELPTRIPEVSNENVSVLIPTPEPSKESLQLYTFLPVTLTPRPTDMPIPTDTIDEAEMVDCGVDFHASQKPEMIWGYALNASAANNGVLGLKIFFLNKKALIIGSGNVSEMTTSGVDHVRSPNLGDENARDADNFVYFPAIYLTDISSHSDDISGDAQAGGQPNKPNDIYGSWQALGRENTVKNGTNLGLGADPWSPANGPGGANEANFSAEIIWNISNLLAIDPDTKQYNPLQSGHKYRGEVALHDGDNPTNAGVVCVEFQAK